MESRNPVLRREGQYVGFHEPGTAAPRATESSAAAAGMSVEQLQEMYDRPSVGEGRAVQIDDVVIKTAILFVILLAGAIVGWTTAESIPALWIGAAIIGFVLALVNIFKKVVSPPLVMAYALVQGVFLGGISYFFSLRTTEPIVQQAVLGTLVAFGVMLTLYRTRIIKVNGRFQKIMMVALISYAVIGLASFVSALFGTGGGWGFYGVGGLGLILCMAGVALASLTLALDFEAIAQSISQGLPEREAWRLSFGLMVTLIWLYLEILRFLAILNSGD
jgi:uncharacterized YccA/Bax inhibitor family protein